ncbi:hypothetical protein K2X33_06495 [bacterium]|nr:hypothetical protein [bacterium]
MAITAGSPFVRDMARYLTGSGNDAESVVRKYRDKRPKVLWVPPEKPAIEIPDDFETLRQKLGLDLKAFAPTGMKWERSPDQKWMGRTVQSIVKAGPRRIYRSRPDEMGGLKISIATVNGQEVEIAVQRTNSEDWDFFVYGADGKRQGYSTFHTSKGNPVEGPAPLTCLACHYNRDQGNFERRPLSYSLASAVVKPFVLALSDPSRLGFLASQPQE